MTHEEVLANTAALLNDQARDQYTNTVLLAYYNMAMMELEEIFELNNIPTTNETSAVLDVPDGTTAITFPPDPPIGGVDYLPTDLIDVVRLWWSQDGQDNWMPSTKESFLTANIIGGATQSSSFGVWAWMEQEIRLLAANVDLDVKLDYIRKLFTVLAIGDVDEDLTVINAGSFLQFRTAGLCAEFIMENPTRANSLNQSAILALDRSLGISVKGMQSIIVRRRPFRASWKRRGIIL